MDKTVRIDNVNKTPYEIKQILKKIYLILEEEGYNPSMQMTGWLISGEPVYITSKQGAREMIFNLDRFEVTDFLIQDYCNQ